MIVRTLALLALMSELASGSTPNHWLRWMSLPDLPVPISGQLAGSSNGALIVAGGSYFRTSIFEGGTKIWADSVFVLEPGGSAWKTLKMDRPLAYGGSVSTAAGMILLGGGDAQDNTAEVFRLEWRDGRLERSALPNLPQPVANTSAVLLNNTIYVAGGQSGPADTSALHNFWALDLSSPDAQWQTLQPWPGPARIFPVLAAQAGSVYILSGAELFAGEEGAVSRRYLTDAYRWDPGKGWRRVADVPRPVVAAPVTALGPSHVLVFGGDDGANADRIWELKDQHPGFSRDVLAYNTLSDAWTSVGTLPNGLVTTTAVNWAGTFVIPGGEDRPGHRSATVLGAVPEASRSQFGLSDSIVLAVYLLSIVAMGVFLTSRNRTTGDFFLGGRRIPWWAAGLSIYGTQLSSITFMAMPAKAYAADWTYVLVNVCILIVTPAIVFFYMPFFHRLKITTAYEYLERRFNRAVRLLASALFIFFQLGRLAIVMFLPAIALATVSQMNVYLCIVLMGGMAMIYTALGGIEAVIWTDVVQAVILLGGALLCLGLAVTGIDGGLQAVVETARADAKLHIFDWSWDYTTTTVWVMLLGNLAAVLSTYTTDQTVIQRYLTTSDERKSAKSIWSNAVLTVPSTVIFFSIGTALYVFYKTHPELLDPNLPTDAIFPQFMVQQLPAGVAGLVLAALFAAAQSTISSSIHSVATTLIVDFYRPFRGASSDGHQLRLARILTFTLGIVGTAAALLMATYDIRSLLDTFLTLLSLLGGSLAGIFALGIFTCRTTSAGVFLGGALSALIVAMVRAWSPVHFFLYSVIGLVTCVTLGYGLSLLIRPDNRDLSGLTVFTKLGGEQRGSA